QILFFLPLTAPIGGPTRDVDGVPQGTHLVHQFLTLKPIEIHFYLVVITMFTIHVARHENIFLGVCIAPKTRPKYIYFLVNCMFTISPDSYCPCRQFRQFLPEPRAHAHG